MITWRSAPFICLSCAATVVTVILSACSNQSTESAQSVPVTGVTDVRPNPPPAESSSHTLIGKAPPATNGMSALVILEPQTPLELPAQTVKPVMDQISLTFIPGLLFVRTGQPVEFRNSDETLHNINVKDDATKEQAFNVAIPTGITYNHTFQRDGLYNVGCDIHAGMSAVIISSSTPFTTIADSKGNFVFEDVTPGLYTVRVYAGNQQLERSVEVAGARTEVSIEGP
jgi:plastocyanin